MRSTSLPWWASPAPCQRRTLPRRSPERDRRWPLTPGPGKRTSSWRSCALDRRRRDEARSHVDAALASNPHAPEAFAIRAALAAVEGRAADLEADAKAALAINPRDARAWRVPSEHVAGHYRFEEAVALARRAVEVDPDDPAARSTLGMHLMRTGDEEAARTELDVAFARDPYDVVTYNLLGLLDTLQGFQSVREGDLVFKFHPEDAGILGEFAPALAREALASMSARYGFTPSGPILIELFPRHDDFAVRTLGLPGMIGALGACFGKVVTLDSPRARPPGTFHWEATLWHELAHVVTLQLSKQRVPRWLTEGSRSTRNDSRAPSGAASRSSTFVQGLDEGLAIPLASLNDGFADPRRIALAYQQASLVVEFLVGRYGFDAIMRMLRAYGEGLDDAAVFARELQNDAAGLQAGFDAFVEERFGAMRVALRVPDGVEIGVGDVTALRALADRQAEATRCRWPRRAPPSRPASQRRPCRISSGRRRWCRSPTGPRVRASCWPPPRWRVATAPGRCASSRRPSRLSTRLSMRPASSRSWPPRPATWSDRRIAHGRISEVVPHEAPRSPLWGVWRWRRARRRRRFGASAWRWRLAPTMRSARGRTTPRP